MNKSINKLRDQINKNMIIYTCKKKAQIRTMQWSCKQVAVKAGSRALASSEESLGFDFTWGCAG